MKNLIWKGLLALALVAGPAVSASLACAVGDRVWKDVDADGIQDDGEPGIPGAGVELYTCAGALVASATTGADGYYLFPSLSPGKYYLVFDQPDGYAFTLQDQGADDALDSNPDASGRTMCVDLASGETDLTVDAGVVEAATAAIGDLVWEDVNRNGVQEADEPGIAGARVELYACDGALLASTTTDANGLYLFSNLGPDDYSLKFYAPTGYFFTVANVGSDETRDSDAETATGETVCTALVPGETDRTWDAGLWQAMPAIDIEKYTNGQDADTPTGPQIPVGGTVTWTYVVTNTGTVPLHDVAVTDDKLGAICTFGNLAVGASQTCTRTGTAVAGQYANLGTVVGSYGDTTISDRDPSHYYGKAPAPGTGTPGYWKNHPKAWPVDAITIGGRVYTKAEAIALMGCPDGNKLFTMFRALVAAKLNVLGGNDASCIAGTIASADAWMAQYGPMPTACRGLPRVGGSSAAWVRGEPLYWRLDDYNNGRICAPSRDAMP